MRYLPKSMDRARARAKDLKSTLGKLGVEVTLTKAQHAISRAFGSADWAQMAHAIERNSEGFDREDDDALLIFDISERRVRQAKAISEALGVDLNTALVAVTAVRPSGDPAIKVTLDEALSASVRDKQDVTVPGVASSEIDLVTFAILDEAFGLATGPDCRAARYRLPALHEATNCHQLGARRSYLQKFASWIHDCAYDLPQLARDPEGVSYEECLELLVPKRGIVTVSGPTNGGRHSVAFAALVNAHDMGRSVTLSHTILGGGAAKRAVHPETVVFVGEPRWKADDWLEIADLARDTLVVMIQHAAPGGEMRQIEHILAQAGRESVGDLIVGGVRTERLDGSRSGFRRSVWKNDAYGITASAAP